MSVCERKRERESVCVCVRERERASHCHQRTGSVAETTFTCLRRVCVRERVSVCEIVCERVRV